jgi:GTP-binding protein
MAQLHILKATYLVSSPGVDVCPPDDRPEYAFIGRSNVGKSSLINMLCNNQKLAKTSGSPGKTKLINHFEILSTSEEPGVADRKKPADRWYLVDLPGYGYAKVAQQERKQFQKMIVGYIKDRKNLMQLFVLVDSRHTPQKADVDFINRLGEWKMPFCILFTKTDKITQKEVAHHVKLFMEELGKYWDELPGYFLTSALKKRGVKEITGAIALLNKKYKQQEQEEKAKDGK